MLADAVMTDVCARSAVMFGCSRLRFEFVSWCCQCRVTKITPSIHTNFGKCLLHGAATHVPSYALLFTCYSIYVLSASTNVRSVPGAARAPGRASQQRKPSRIRIRHSPSKPIAGRRQPRGPGGQSQRCRWVTRRARSGHCKKGETTPATRGDERRERGGGPPREPAP